MTDEYSGLITQQKKYSKFSDKKHSGVSKLSNAHNDQGEAALLLNKCREIFVMLREKSIKHVFIHIYLILQENFARKHKTR